jgi:FtsP/CotA-like multicopper oxidase with cupredoxin domain
MSVREAVAPQISTRIEEITMAAPARRFVVRSYSAALLILGAAAIHFAVAPEHFQEYLPFGLFFIGLGLAQLALAVAVLMAPSRRLYVIASGGTVAVIAIWLMSRTVGLPLGPDPWTPEPVGFIDLLASIIEATAVLVLLRRIRIPIRSSRVGRIRRALTTTPAVLAAVLAVFTGVGVAANPMMVAYNAAPAVPGQPSTSLVTLTAQPGPEPVKAFTLTAAPARIGGQDAWAYNGTVPGPELRVTQGDRVRVTLVNHLPASTSIHWHGVILPNAEDGVSGITQDAVPSGGTYTYDFVANDAGTYWYHSHQDTMNQIPRGLFGSLVVEPNASTPTVRDYTLLIHTLPNSNAVAVNGSASLHLDANPGDTVRLRVIDAISAMDFGPTGTVQMPVLVGVPYTVAALDGHDLNQPQPLGPERIPLGMGQRADLVFTMPSAGAVRLVGIRGIAPFPWSRPTTASVTIGNGPVPAVKISSLPTFDLTGYGVAAPDAVLDATRFDVTRQIVLAGGTPMFRNGTFDFADTFNGQASPSIQPINVRFGDLVRLHIVNRSRQTHPIHIHGHVFSVLAKNGRPISGSPVHLDAILVGPGDSWDVGFVADNPGIWMLHCHVLIHAAGGMSMTINYEGISTPYTMGTRSGNVPE